MSIYDKYHIPEEVGSFLFVFAFILLLSPYLSGVNFGILRVPTLGRKARRRLMFFGPLFVVVAIVPFLPLWSGDGVAGEVSIDACNFYRDEPNDDGSWAIYLPEDHGEELFWVGCRVEATKDIVVSSLQVGGQKISNFTVGYFFEEQRKEEEVTLQHNSTEWLSVPFEIEEWASNIELFQQSTWVLLIDAEGNEIAREKLRGINEL